MRLHAGGLADLSWREFEDYVTGLLAANTRLGRFFAPRSDQATKGR